MLYGLLNLLRAMSQKQRKRARYPAAKIAITVRLSWLCAFLVFYLEGAKRPVSAAIRPISIYQNSYLFPRVWGIKQKKLLLKLKMISLLLFPQASEPSMNFNTSKLVYFSWFRSMVHSLSTRCFTSSLLRPAVIYDLYLQAFLRSCARVSSSAHA